MFVLSTGFVRVAQVARGLCALAQQRFVHLDLKPDNVVLQNVGGDGLDAYPIPVLVDFGHARQLPDESMVEELSKRDVNNRRWGNTPHIAPELLLEYQRVQVESGPARLDFSKQPVFELGVLAYEICAGEHPFEDYPASLDDGEAFLELRALQDTYPPEFVDLCRRMVRPASPSYAFSKNFV
jgi:serine/threonine protein kinase